MARTVVTDDTDTVAIVHIEVEVLKHIDGNKGAVDRFHVDEFPSHGFPSLFNGRRPRFITAPMKEQTGPSFLKRPERECLLRENTVVRTWLGRDERHGS